MHFPNYKRLFFAHLPTPLEPLKNLSQIIGGPNIWIKRDDCTGLAGGGNKTRKLEFLMADALRKDSREESNVIITQGATQSNHVRQTAAISTKLNLECHVLLEDRTQMEDLNHLHNGNVLLDQLFNAKVIRMPGGSNMPKAMEDLARQLIEQENKKPYLIPGGGSNGIGALGYANAALELISQSNDMNLKIDHVVHATGSSGTQAGLVAGFKAMNSRIPVLGIGVRLEKSAQELKVLECAREVGELLQLKDQVVEQDIVANCDYVGEGYGIPAESTLEAIHLVAKSEGILLDPVYSGKAMAGLIDLARKNYFKPSDHIVFVHTGGAQALPGYLDWFVNAVKK